MQTEIIFLHVLRLDVQSQDSDRLDADSAPFFIHASFELNSQIAEGTIGRLKKKMASNILSH